MKPKNKTTSSKQHIESANILGNINQESDADFSDQKIKDIEAFGLNQKTESEKQNISFGKYAASGKWALISLVVIIIVNTISEYVISKN